MSRQDHDIVQKRKDYPKPDKNEQRTRLGDWNSNVVDLGGAKGSLDERGSFLKVLNRRAEAFVAGLESRHFNKPCYTSKRGRHTGVMM
jgi:hypothetical protein